MMNEEITLRSIPNAISEAGIRLHADYIGRINTSIISDAMRAVTVPEGTFTTQGMGGRIIDVEVSKRIKGLIQMAHNAAPKGKSDDFYEGLSYALSVMEQQG